MGYREENILQELINEYDPKKFLVDIGAKEVAGSNTWLLIAVHYWRGILVEPHGERCVQLGNVLRERRLSKSVKVIQDWALPSNINNIVPEKCGILSIDIDGQDYHVWKALKHQPTIVVIEYNPLRFGVKSKMKRIDKYNWKTDRVERRLAYGSSKECLISLGRSKGYDLVNFTDYNLFFARR